MPAASLSFFIFGFFYFFFFYFFFVSLLLVLYIISRLKANHQFSTHTFANRGTRKKFFFVCFCFLLYFHVHYFPPNCTIISRLGVCLETVKITYFPFIYMQIIFFTHTAIQCIHSFHLLIHSFINGVYFH